MRTRLRLNRFDIFALVCLIVTTILWLPLALSVAQLYDSLAMMTDARRAIGCLGWAITTFGPVVAAVGFWRWCKTSRRFWIPHLLYLPCAIGLFAGGDSMMLYATDESDWDSVIGAPIIQAMVLWLLMTIGYYVAALYEALARLRRRSGLKA